MTSGAMLDSMSEGHGGWTARGPRPSALLRMHRDDRTHLLVTGGTAERRSAVARAFHRESPVRQGSLLVVDCRVDAARLDAALACWLSVLQRDCAQNPLRAAERGTLFLDHVDTLEPLLQRRLLAFARALSDGAISHWAGRLTTGAASPLEVAVAEQGFLPELFDCLDQVRISLAACIPQDPS